MVQGFQKIEMFEKSTNLSRESGFYFSRRKPAGSVSSVYFPTGITGDESNEPSNAPKRRPGDQENKTFKADTEMARISRDGGGSRLRPDLEKTVIRRARRSYGIGTRVPVLVPIFVPPPASVTDGNQKSVQVRPVLFLSSFS